MPKGHLNPGRNRCGAKTARGFCGRPAGWGTDHVGIGSCKTHGGRAQTHIRNTWKIELTKRLGYEMEIDPIGALMLLVRMSAGDMAFWRDKVLQLQDQAEREGLDYLDTLTEKTVVGRQLVVAVREYKSAQESLARYSKMALDAGIAERAQRLAENYGELIAKLIKNILGDLFDTPIINIKGQRGTQYIRRELEKRAAEVVPKRLLELEPGKENASKLPQWEEAIILASAE